MYDKELALEILRQEEAPEGSVKVDNFQGLEGV